MKLESNKGMRDSTNCEGSCEGNKPQMKKLRCRVFINKVKRTKSNKSEFCICHYYLQIIEIMSMIYEGNFDR